ncbi:hypothetical protein SAMN05443248_7629 [Bradyrhizobium erythrophlei]|uniref:Uncharacterized protein n=1 Tax=Bradyrhizobium erythrophlei TaxID=1437360 RepID=A0A1M5XUJ7_9BRAD|nr:hypothetical protein SAMN05443248_7629 [Bradyrhizobium erythrophlei]
MVEYTLKQIAAAGMPPDQAAPTLKLGKLPFCH